MDAMVLLYMVLAFAVATATTASPLRAVDMIEETPAAAAAASDSYVLCDSLDLTLYTATIYNESNDCVLKTTYRWSSTALPTPTQRRELCSCTLLFSKVRAIGVPQCLLIRDGREITYAQLVGYAFGLCTPSGNTVATPTLRPSTATPSSSANATTPSPSRGNKGKASPPTDTTAPTENTSKSNVGVVAIVGALVVVVAIAALWAVKYWKTRRASAKNESNHDEEHVVGDTPSRSPMSGLRGVYQAMSSSIRSPGSPTIPATVMNTNPSTFHASGSSVAVSSTNTAQTARPTETATWNDPVLQAVRVPYDMVFFGPLLSRGGYGEVFKGTYNGETVAIKRLLPERRKDLAQIDAFLNEAKLMSTLEHERIIQFIGVAWNALSDACVIVEIMENGDLRSAITRWDREEMRPQGFDADKVKIALHIAHALTYLHSLQPVVVHRDLKSKNILLNATYDAKLTDFGVSRERADSTMTGGVGSSLWMAPEVMLGERYDEKADIFSFGVVLSELDTQRLPYDHAKETGTDRKVADSAILQMVSLGRLEVAFTEHARADLVQLGRDCVQLDSKRRPSSAVVLHRVHTALRSL